MWRRLLILPGVLAYTLLLYWMFTLAFPFLVDGIQRVRQAVNDAKGTSGLIFVESPEVYTRQRLVNDRYLQDAWLRQKLAEIDSGDSLFIDTAQVRQQFLDLNVEATTTLTPGSVLKPDTPTPQTQDRSLPELPQITQVPFRAKFELQSAARDKIRQLILENALDDRHDLSGNTVFGLKFDTAVLPGSQATLSPTVIVRMASNPVEQLQKGLPDLAQHFVRVFGPETESLRAAEDKADLEILTKLDRHFDAWRNSVEQRLNEHKGEEAEACQLPRAEVARDLATPMCVAGTLSERGQQLLRKAYGEADAVDDALYFILRMPRREISFQDDYLGVIEDEARAACRQAAAIGENVNVDAFIGSRQGIANRFALPDPWGQMLDMSVQSRPDNGPRICGAALDLSLDGLELPVVFVERALDAEEETILVGSGWRPVDCQTERCLTGQTSVWAQYRAESREARLAVEDALDNPTLNTLNNLATDISEKTPDQAQLCFLEWVEDGRPEWFFIGNALPDGYAGNSKCFPGETLYFRLGSFGFLKRMTQVESYTYAAFPRGDVSGVVTETGDRQSLSGGLSGLPSLGAGLNLGLNSRSSTTEAQPSLINFAAGEGRRGDVDDASKIFDFGWSIVKDGIKKPMIASQLVLVSVPAYLDEIELEVWKGFLDIDRVPLNREDFNDIPLDARIERLMPSFEKRTVSLKLPPDYPALDGVVFSTSLVTGPRIKTSRLQGCYGVRDTGQLTVAISGERLWRSTVVTLDGIKASQIEVMPDMGGILAHFDGLPLAAPGGGPGDVVRLLEVWTSEGRDKTEIRVAHNPQVDACDRALAGQFTGPQPRQAD